MAQSTIQTRLCPHCANSIALDALNCPYCRASLDGAPVPQWPDRDAEEPTVVPESRQGGLPLGSKIILVLGLLVFGVGVYLVGGLSQHPDMAPVIAAKDQALQDSAEKIKALETQLAQSRDELKTSAAQLDEFKTKFSEQDKLLVAAYNRIKESSRDAERLASRPAATPPPARSRDPMPPAPASAPAPRRVVEPGLYETVRSTSVHEEPLAGSRVVSRIVSGTQINVVRGVGEWLEVRSKQGNPPGFVRADDAMLVTRAN